MMAHITYQPHINGLRAVAVLSVILFHLQIGALPGGFVGVDVFFVISGYLMTRIIVDGLDKPGFSIPRFWLNRVARVAPALLVMSAAVLALGAALLLPAAFTMMGKDAIWSNLFAVNYRFAAVTGYFSPAAEHSWFLHCWSLAVEFQFYVIFPIMLWVAHRIGGRRAILALLLVASAASAGLSWIETPRSPTQAFYLLPARFWEFAAGGLLVFLPSLRRFNMLVALAGAALIAFAAFTFDRFYVYPGLWPGLPVLGAALIIWAAPQRSPLDTGPMQFIGTISYSLYLWHWPVIMAAKYLGFMSPFVLVLTTVPAMLLLAWASHRWVETPFRSMFRASLAWPALAAAMPLVALIAASSWIIDKNGLPKRIPKRYAAVIATGIYGDDYREGRCFLRPAQGFSDFAPECMPSVPDEATSLMIWGDSHAAHLYPGIAAEPWASSFSIQQATASGCRPFLDGPMPDRPNCPSVRTAIRERIAADPPDIVVLATSGLVLYDYPGTSYAKEYAFAVEAPLTEAIKFLKGAGVRNVVLIGPVPQWDVSLPEAFYRQRFRPGENRVAPRQADRLFATDAILAREAPRLGAVYVSPVSRLCANGQCKTSESGKLLQFDGEHFTLAGSKLIASSGIRPALPAHAPGG